MSVSLASKNLRAHVPALLLTTAATLLAFLPQVFPHPLALALGALLLLVYPGYLLEQILFDAREWTLVRLPVWFVFSLAIWSVPATALQVLGANWFAFRVVFVCALWGLTLAVIWWSARRKKSFSPYLARDNFSELVLLALCVVTGVIVARGLRDGDDWMYLQIVQQMMASDPFQIRAASEVRYSIRFAAHVWLFAQAFLGKWLNADVVPLTRDILPTLLAPLALISFYAWGKTFFNNARAGLAAVLIQFAIYVTFVRADGWGMGFLGRSAQDKFLVWLVFVPVATLLAWQFLREGKRAFWVAYGVVLLAGLWVHPISLYLVVLTLGGFALFNLLSRAPFARGRWMTLLIVTLPVLLSPLVMHATTAPILFTVNTPQVAAYLRLSVGRLLLQPPFYLADPALLAHPAIFFALALLVLFAPRLRSDVRVQFLWGSTLVPLALLFNPFTARLIGEMFTPWHVWRMTWNIPAALILTQGILFLPDAWARAKRARWQWAMGAMAMLFVLGGCVWLADLNLARTWKNLNAAHALDAPVEEMMQQLRVTLQTPSLILLPRKLTRYAPTYTYNALVMTDNAHLREGAGGQEIDRFYAEKSDTKFLDKFLADWKIEYVVVENGSPQDIFLQTRARTTRIYGNTGLTLYKLDAAGAQ